MDEGKQTTRYVLFHIATPHDCADTPQLSSLLIMISTVTLTHTLHSTKLLQRFALYALQLPTQ